MVGTIGPAPKGHAEVVERCFLDSDHVTTVDMPFDRKLPVLTMRGTSRRIRVNLVDVPADRKLRVLTLPRADIDAAIKKAQGAVQNGGG